MSRCLKYTPFTFKDETGIIMIKKPNPGQYSKLLANAVKKENQK